jgi:hypothetical protein
MKRDACITESRNNARFCTAMSNVSAEEYARTHLFEPILTEALAALSQEKPANPTKWLAEYLLEHNPNKPHVVSIGSPKMKSKGEVVSTSNL